MLSLGLGRLGLVSNRVIDTSDKITAIFGDSLTEQNTTDDKLEAQGYMVVTNYKTFNRFDFQPSRNFGVDGNTTAQMDARKTDLAAVNPDVVFVMGGTNDLAAETSPATIQANLSSIYTYITGTLGATVIAMPIPPRSYTAAGFNPTQIAQAKLDINTVNDWIATQASNNIIVVSGMYAALESETADEPNTDYIFDDAHHNPKGAEVIADAIIAVTNPIFGNRSSGTWKQGTNILPVTGTSGTGGTFDAGFTGEAADDWDFDSLGTADPSFRTLSKTDKDYQRFILDVPSGSGNDIGIMALPERYQAPVTGGVYYFECLMNIRELSGCDEAVWELREEGTPGNVYHDVLDDQGGREMPALGWGLARTPTFTVTNNPVTNLRPRFTVRGDATSQAISADIEFEEVRLVQVS